MSNKKDEGYCSIESNYSLHIINKPRLIVLYEENKANPQNTWSGTSYRLRKALENYFDIIFINLRDGFFLSLLKKISCYVGKRGKAYITGKVYDASIRMKANCALRKYAGIPVLEISKDVRVKNPYYIYQDLCVEYTNYIRGKMDNQILGGLKLYLSEYETVRMAAVQTHLYSKANAIFFMGNWMAEYMKEYHKDISNKIFAVGGGINPEFDLQYPITIEEKEPIILFNGIDFERKGGKLVIEAFRIARELNNEIKLFIVGPDVNLHEERIECRGKISRGELSKILRKASLLCLPSVFEAYGLAFPEALCYGVPCIGRNEFEMPYFIVEGKNGYLLNDDNPNDLAELMIRAINNEEMLKYTISNAFFESKRYSWDAVAKKIAETINIYTCQTKEEEDLY